MVYFRDFHNNNKKLLLCVYKAYRSIYIYLSEGGLDHFDVRMYDLLSYIYI